MSILLLSFLAACSDGGSGEVTTSDDAPWDMNGASAFLFIPGADNSGRSGTGVLAISTESGHGCADVASTPPVSGSGLWFEVEYFTGRSEGAASPAWDGLYAAGIATSADTGASRSLSVGGWHKGFVYAFEGTDAWLDVSQGAQDKFIGSFSTDWWKGEFDAEVCEDIDLEADTTDEESPGGEDTGSL